MPKRRPSTFTADAPATIRSMRPRRSRSIKDSRRPKCSIPSSHAAYISWRSANQEAHGAPSPRRRSFADYLYLHGTLSRTVKLEEVYSLRVTQADLALTHKEHA